MPVIPNFSAFAPTPNLANAFLGGRTSAQRDTEIANQAAQARDQLAMQQQKLAQDAQQAQMEMQAKQTMLEQEQLRKQQEMAIEGQYKQQLIGLKQLEMEGAQAKLQQEALQAAQQFAARQSIEREMAQPGADPLKIYSKYAPSAGVAPGSFADLLSNQSKGAHVPRVLQLPDAGEGFAAVETAPGRWQVTDAKKREIAEANSELAQNRFQYQQEAGYAGLGMKQEALDQGRARIALAEKTAEAAAATGRIKMLQNAANKDEDGKNMFNRMLRGSDKPLTPGQQKLAKDYAVRLEEIAKLTNQLVTPGETAAAAPAQAAPANVELKKGEAVQTLGNGRKAIFDTTKNPPEFLRYAD